MAWSTGQHILHTWRMGACCGVSWLRLALVLHLERFAPGPSQVGGTGPSARPARFCILTTPTHPYFLLHPPTRSPHSTHPYFPLQAAP